MALKNMVKSFITFRFIILVGIAFGLWLFYVQSDKTPLAALLTEKMVYFMSFLFVLGFHALLWIFVEKLSLSAIGERIVLIMRDSVVINVVVLSTVAMCFLLHTFIL